MKKIGIVSTTDDLHVKSVSYLAGLKKISVCHFCSDDVARCDSSGYISNTEKVMLNLHDSNGEYHSADEFGVIWWRRSSPPQIFLDDTHKDEIKNIVNRSASLHLISLYSAFSVKCKLINNPINAIAAEVKLTQLRKALEVGLLIPSTLISNNPIEIKKFFTIHNRKIIMKSYCSTETLSIKTTLLESVFPDEQLGIRMSPMIYQEVVEGEKHYRVVIIGDEYVASLFISKDIDSRIDLTAKVEAVKIPEQLFSKLKNLLVSLGLKIGIIDLKENYDGSIYFLEINQQGQFAYLDAISSTQGLDMMTRYLITYCK